MKRIAKIALALALIVACLGLAASLMDTYDRPQPDQPVGHRRLTLEVPHRDQALNAHLWYPTEATGDQVLVGQNALFFGEWVIEGAAPRKGALPLVLLSHGSGGNQAQLGWIATHLARAGFVVAGVNHPGTTSRDSLPSETVKIWQRPADLSRLADQLLTLPDLQIDPERIAVMGFSLGGHTALSLAGLHVSKQRFIDYCDTAPEAWDCAWLRDGGVDFAAIDQTRYEQSNLDPRIKAVVAIDPALPQAVHADSLATMGLPVLIVNLGDAATTPIAIRADHLTEQLAQGRHMFLPDTWHFTFLAKCSPLGQVIIGLAASENICSDWGVRDRSEVQADLAPALADFLSKAIGM